MTQEKRYNGATGANEAYGANGGYEAQEGPVGSVGSVGSVDPSGLFGLEGPFDQVASEPQGAYGSQDFSFLPKKGNYRELLPYKKAVIIYDLTFYFTTRFLNAPKDRTVDQMVQAARSGKQNIAEGSAAAPTSSETELKLTSVARASMQELLADFEDYLRVRNLSQWTLHDERTGKVQSYCNSHYSSDDYLKFADRWSDETIANIVITLIHQFDSIINKYITYLEKNFVEQGGIREQMSNARLGFRSNQKARIAELEAENARLRARIAQLEAQLAKKGGQQ